MNDNNCRFKVGDVVKDGYGVDVEILLIERRALPFSIIALRGTEVVAYGIDGSYSADGRRENRDLIPPKRVVYLNFPKYIETIAYVHETKEAAESFKDSCPHSAIAVPVELPE